MVQELEKDLIEAMKNHEKERLAVIRMVKSAMKQEVIDHKRKMNDELLIEVVNKQIKMRQDSLREFEQANRTDLTSKVVEEIKILEKYLPEQLTDEELNQIIEEVFTQLKPTSAKDMGTLMKEITPLVKGKADMGKVSQIVKNRLN